jgi:hypothetical protein
MRRSQSGHGAARIGLQTRNNILNNNMLFTIMSYQLNGLLSRDWPAHEQADGALNALLLLCQLPLKSPLAGMQFVHDLATISISIK